MARYAGRRISAFVALVAMVAFANMLLSVAAASTTSVSPVQIFLTSENHSTLLTITNEGSESARFQMNVFAWSQSERGRMQLAPTSDIIFFPVFIAVAPGESRKIRVGTTLPAPEREKTYRLFLQELPPGNTARESVSPMQIRVLSTIGVPIFLRPVVNRSHVVFSDVVFRRNRGTVSISNDGTVFAQPGTLSLSALDADDRRIYEQHWQPWYLLAGNSLAFDFSVPPSVCAKVRTITASVKVNEQAVTRKTSTPNGVCPR